MHRWTRLALTTALAVAALPAAGQVVMPRASPHATVTQRIGVTDISIDYHRPGVKGRKIWGELVPYGQPWRVGANDRTIIEFSTDVTVDGQPLPAGSYGLVAIPSETTWTLAFSKVTAAWGAFTYDAKDDAARITVTPEATTDAVEWMEFRFEDLGTDTAKIALRWEKLRVPFTVKVDLDKTVAAHVAANASWGALNGAATWANDRGTDLDLALRWANASIAIEKTFFNLRTKARILAKKGDKAAAVATGEEALQVAAAMATPPGGATLPDFKKEVEGWKK
ncbi:MAG: DUF2911 domain-containing protein [Thermoanaerobaculia bacterium]|nr:DUF2911 domain-containing protein [Thermoanaerobaculia bacterium]